MLWPIDLTLEINHDDENPKIWLYGRYDDVILEVRVHTSSMFKVYVHYDYVEVATLLSVPLSFIELFDNLR